MRIATPSSLLLGALLALIVGGAVGFVAVQALGGAGGGLVGLAAAGLVVFLDLRRPLRRRRVAQRAFPGAWRCWLTRHVPLYAMLEARARRRFERDVQFFLEEHTFEGVDGVAVEDELRLAVAAGAALLLNGRPGWELHSAGRSVLFYPAAFDEAYYGGDYAAFDGMAHAQGPMLLSAQAVRASWAAPGAGQNVVLHELAHLFDFQSEGADGIPSLMAPASEAAWRALVRRETQRIRRGRSLLRDYAASAPSEFFAVAVEVFFERPAALRRHHGELYEALQHFFNLDPAALMGERPQAGPAARQKDLRSGVRKSSPDLTQPSGL